MARSFSAGSSRSITQGDVSGARISEQTVCSLSGWFKTSDTGTTRMVVYNETSGSGGNINLFFALNDGTAGQVRLFRRDNSSNTVSITNGTTWNDGQWHHFCYIGRSLSDHELYIDGNSVGTSSTNLSGTKTSNSQAIGRREAPTGTASGYFTGDIADVATFGIALSTTQITNLKNKAPTHPMNVSATFSDLRCYLTLAQGVLLNARDVLDQANLTRAAWTINNGTTAVDGPDGAGPTGMVATTDISKAWICMGLTGTSLVVPGGSDEFREPGNVVHDPTDASKPFKMYFSRTGDPYTGSNTSIWMAYATTIGGTWTTHGEVIPAATLPMEDPWVYRDPATGTYHLWAENKTGGTNADGIAHFTSSDGITWSLENATAIDNGAGGTWDATDVSSPIVWKEAANDWRMIYEGRGVGNAGKIGYATATSPNGPWTKSGSNPVMGLGAGGTWDDDAVVPDSITKIGSTYWLTYHGDDGSGTSWKQGIAYSTDLTTWTKVAHNPVTTTAVFHALMMMATDFDRAYTIASGEEDILEIQMYGDAAVQTSEWPDVSAGGASQGGMLLGVAA